MQSFILSSNYPVPSLLHLRSSASICGPKVKLFLLYGWCLFIAGSSFAGLEWKSTSQKIEVHALQSSETVSFGFTNTGNGPVTITDLKPSCGCISGKVAKKTYAPGESGTVQVEFALQGRVGAQHKGLAVITDDNPTNPTQLYVDTTIPKSYTPSTKRVTWNAGVEHSEKTIRLTNASKTAFPLEKAVPAREDLTVELKTIREGFVYDLVITPAADLEKTIIPIIIHPERPDGVNAMRTYTVYALVK